jgi:hypothetical protein
MSDNLFNLPGLTDRDQRLIEAYAAAGRTLDDLPYTKEFDRLLADVGPDFEGRADQVFRRLHNLRKQARLPKSGLRGVSPAAVKPEEKDLLTTLVVKEVGSLGQRDQLPYTEAFARVHTAFNAAVGRSVPPHDLWRLIARLAK